MKYSLRTFIALFSILMSPYFMSCENLIFIDAAQLYIISFETNGGSEIEAHRTDIIEKVPVTTKEDAEFLGWYTASDFSSDKISFPYKLKEDTTLYAKWVQKYQVLFESNGGSVIASYKASIIKDEPITLKNENIFMGWYTTPDFSGAAISFPYTLTEPTVFYAKWSQIFTIQFETNGGTAVSDICATSIPECPESSKKGYVLSGWYLDENLTTPVSFPYKLTKNTTLYAKWLESPNTKYTVEHYQQDTNLRSYSLIESETFEGKTNSMSNAKARDYSGFHPQDFPQSKIEADGSSIVKIYYERNKYTVHFNANGGAGTMNNQIFYYGVAQNLNKNSFSLTNYSFIGWSLSETSSEKYTDCESVLNLSSQNEAIIDLYAQWFAGSIVTASTIKDLDLSNLSVDHTIKVIGSISNGTISELSSKIAAANYMISLDLSETNGLVDIVANAFSGRRKLATIVFPSSLRTIGTQAFYNCSSLSSAVFSDTNSTWICTHTSGTSTCTISVENPTLNATYLQSNYTGKVTCYYSWSKK
mgnify:CR=1 FL=1